MKTNQQLKFFLLALLFGMAILIPLQTTAQTLNVPPTIVCPADIVVSNNPGVCEAVATWTPLIVTDAFIVSTHNPGDTFPVGTTTVTYNVITNADGPINSPLNSPLKALGNGDSGEAVAYNPIDGKMYHASGVSPGEQYFEAIDLGTFTVGPNILLNNNWPPGPNTPPGFELTTEITGMVYYPPLNGFVLIDIWGNIYLADTITGNINPIATLVFPAPIFGQGFIRGLAVVGTSIYGVATQSSELIEFDPITGATLSTIPVFIDGTEITSGSTGLTTDPNTGTVYIIYKEGSGRNLGTIDVSTGIGTDIGNTGMNFSGLSFDASGNLYGISGDGANLPETLFIFNNGNSVDCSFGVTVLDTEAPALTCPSPITVNTDAGACSASVVLPSLVVFDNCGVTVESLSLNGKTIFNYEVFVDTGIGGLDIPRNIIFGPDGNLYVSNLIVGGTLGGSILRYDGVTGAFIDEFVSPGLLSFPRGLQFGPDGNLYVASNRDAVILKFDGNTGAFMGPFSATEPFPTGIIFGPGDDLLVADSFGSVTRYDGVTGANVGVFVSGLDFPIGLTYGPDGNLYVSDFNGNNITRYNGTTGAFIDDFVTSGLGGLNGPEGLEFGPDGNLYVNSFGNGQVLSYDGTSGTFLNEVSTFGSRLENPDDGLTFGPDGLLYVSDQGSDRIVRYPLGAGAVEIPPGVNQIMLTASDFAGNIGLCSYTITVTDTENPIIVDLCAKSTDIIYTGTVEDNGPFGPTTVEISSSVGGGIPGYSYSWSPGGETSSSITISPMVTTTYMLTVTDSEGCTSGLSKTIQVLPLSDAVCSADKKNVKFSVCHIPPGNSANPQNICISANTLNAHLTSGNNGHNNCYLGPCRDLCISTPLSNDNRVVDDSELVEEKYNSKFIISSWPNPSDNFFNLNIATPNQLDKAEIQVIDISGKRLYVDSFNWNDNYQFGEKLESGIYFVRISQGKYNKILRVIKR